MTSSTPKNSVNPTATKAYIMPSMSPFMTYWASSPASIAILPLKGAVILRCEARSAEPRRMPRATVLRGSLRSLLRTTEKVLLPGQLALAGGVLAVLPQHPFAVLHHVSGDQRHRVLAVIVERDFADDGFAVLDVTERIAHRLAVRADLLDRVEDQLHGGE